MPTKPSRARRWIKEGKAIGKFNDLDIFYVQLTDEPSDNKTQPIAIGIDPGKLFSGIGVQSSLFTLWKAGASHFCNKQLYLDAKYLYGKPFREFIDFQRFSKLCDWNQNRYYKSLLTLLSIYTHYIIGMLPWKAHLELPFKRVRECLDNRCLMRRGRRKRRINRQLPFNLRAHRQKRFSNRRQGKLAPSIRANRQRLDFARR